MLTCEDVNGFLADYIDGTLPESLQERYEAHLAGCKTCSTYLSQYRKTINLSKSAGRGDPELPQELVERTLDFLHAHLDDAD